MSPKPEKQSAGIGKGTPGPGRVKGKPNKLTADVKQMILTALNNAGGTAYLTEQARENPTAFMTLVGKILPKEVVGAGGEPLIPSTVTIKLVEP